MKTNTVEKLIEAVQLVLRALSANKELQKRMSAYGFTPQSLREGTALLSAVQLTTDTREQTSREARHLSHRIAEDRKTARMAFRTHVAIARTAFLHKPLLLRDLHIERMAPGNWGWAKQALDFYKEAPSQMARLQQFGATVESFGQNQAAVQALLDMKAQRLDNKGKSEDITQERNGKIKELRAWYGDFRRLARVAFKDNPQLLETFGMVVPSSPRRRKAIPNTQS